MTLASRTGWFRLGIVLSIAWLCGVCLYIWRMWSDSSESFNSQVLSSASGGPWAVVGQQAMFVSCRVAAGHSTCSPRLDNVAILFFFPLVSAWLLAFAFLWVRTGFHRKQA
jgi:hypothetical protein